MLIQHIITSFSKGTNDLFVELKTLLSLFVGTVVSFIRPSKSRLGASLAPNVLSAMFQSYLANL